MEDSPEGLLVKQAKKGNIEAFTELARRHQEKIYMTILTMIRDHVDADDLAQETFMQAFKHLRSFKQNSSFYTWIYRIAVNVTINFLKKKKKEKSDRPFDDRVSAEDVLKASIPSPEKHSLKKEFQEKLKEAIDALPWPYKVSFTLVVFQGMTHSQAARVLKCSENTVSWRMHKARKMLQQKLKTYLEGE